MKEVIRVEVLKTTERNAKLVTDGEKVCWVQGGWVRNDLTLTPCGARSLKFSKMTIDNYKKESEKWSDDPEVRRVARERELEEKRAKDNEIVKFLCNEDDFQGGSDKAWKVRTNATQRIYGKICSVWVYLPKSITIAYHENGKVCISLPPLVV